MKKLQSNGKVVSLEKINNSQILPYGKGVSSKYGYVYLLLRYFTTTVVTKCKPNGIFFFSGILHRIATQNFTYPSLHFGVYFGVYKATTCIFSCICKPISYINYCTTHTQNAIPVNSTLLGTKTYLRTKWYYCICLE